MRIRDWSSDLCSSDLRTDRRRHAVAGVGVVPFGRSARGARLSGDREPAVRRLPRRAAHLWRDPARPILSGSPPPQSRGGHREDLPRPGTVAAGPFLRSEEHTSELQSLMRISYADICLNKKNTTTP